MSDQTPKKNKKPFRLAMVDFRDGTRPNEETEALTKLVIGSDPILYDHTGKKTAFATWIATRRNRLKKAFAYDRYVRNVDAKGVFVRDAEGRIVVTKDLLPEGQFYIWIASSGK